MSRQLFPWRELYLIAEMPVDGEFAHAGVKKRCKKITADSPGVAIEKRNPRCVE